ncbi:MAG: hypothetical protein H6828_12195 [Planctomycetes bacterium]|nr:hypothetical protein [Planctomycetota bacterium]
MTPEAPDRLRTYELALLGVGLVAAVLHLVLVGATPAEVGAPEPPLFEGALVLGLLGAACGFLARGVAWARGAVLVLALAGLASSGVGREVPGWPAHALGLAHGVAHAAACALLLVDLLADWRAREAHGGAPAPWVLAPRRPRVVRVALALVGLWILAIWWVAVRSLPAALAFGRPMGVLLVLLPTWLCTLAAREAGRGRAFARGSLMLLLALELVLTSLVPLALANLGPGDLLFLTLPNLVGLCGAALLFGRAASAWFAELAPRSFRDVRREVAAGGAV